MNHGRVVNYSGTVATGGTSQTCIALNEKRKWLFVMNPLTATEALYVDFTIAASSTAKTSIELSPGGSLTLEADFCPIDLITVTAVTTAHAYIAKEGI